MQRSRPHAPKETQDTFWLWLRVRQPHKHIHISYLYYRIGTPKGSDDTLSLPCSCSKSSIELANENRTLILAAMHSEEMDLEI